MAQVFETINNNTVATATPLGNIRNNPFVRGSLPSNDAADFFKFQVDRPTKGGVTVVPDGLNVNLSLLNGKFETIRTSLNPGTAAESISFENLPADDYTLLVSKVGGVGSGNYFLSGGGSAVTRAQLSVTVDRIKALERFDSPVPFTRFGEADFFIEVNRFPASVKSKVFKDRNDVRPNFVGTIEVGTNPFASATLSATDRDSRVDFDDRADLHPIRNTNQLNIGFDPLKNEIRSLDGAFGPRKENAVITVQGDGGDRNERGSLGFHKARVSFRVNYDSFTSSVPSFNNRTPITVGNNRGQFFRGRSIRGIIDGRGGRDDISGMGGDDVLIGGGGNDKLNGNTGKDLIWGGLGRDIQTGGAGRDIFVLDLGKGVDVIKDFQDGRDKLGLYGGLTSEALEITREGRNVGISAGSDKLAILKDLRPNQITAADFVQVDFTQFKGITTPYAVV